ncbi:phage tail spike protein [Sporosarcina sp. E16_8]|uniref:phage tail spike protein n=1 Tax=Sporosarcina sp. E16_8 TaxID=2789295 RepID=UPI001A922263|nr:phage tail spike protein [Sporosarcina sp. E16_8]MBO0586452.1 phage tail protein [Sporosarcina sp. E16_8]
MELKVYNDLRNELGTIKNYKEPSIYEEINGPYTFQFETFRESFNLLGPNLVIVDGQDFRIARVVKNRASFPHAKVECEHISYDLLRHDVNFEEIETSPRSIMELLVEGTGFSIGVVEFAGSVLYKPSEQKVRGALIGLARGIGGELVFDNKTVSLIQQRGINRGLEFTLGVNIRDVSEEVDYRIYGQRSYEIDVVDLSELDDYDGFASIEIGDSVQISDPELEINTVQRVISIERDPASKALPRLQIGRVVFDFFNYEDEKEKDPDEEIPGGPSSLKVDFVGIATVDVAFTLDEGDEFPFLIDVEFVGASEVEVYADLIAGVDDDKDEGYKGFFIEFGSASLSESSTFMFSTPYDTLSSATYGLVGAVNPRSVSVVFEEIKTGGKVTGVKALGNWGTGSAPALKVNIMAVCYKAISEAV